MAPLLFGILLAAMRFGGPIAGIKLVFGNDPWRNVRQIHASQSDNPEFLRIMREGEIKRVSRQTSEVQLYAVLGAALFLLASVGFVWKVRDSVGQLRVIYAFGVLACLAILAYAISIAQQPIGSG